MSLHATIWLLAICALIGAGLLFRQQNVVRFVVAFLLFCLSFGAIRMFATFGGRMALAQREQKHLPYSQDFREGVLSATGIAESYYPCVLLATAGLALMVAFSGGRRSADV